MHEHLNKFGFEVAVDIYCTLGNFFSNFLVFTVIYALESFTLLGEFSVFPFRFHSICFIYSEAKLVCAYKLKLQ